MGRSDSENEVRSVDQVASSSANGAPKHISVTDGVAIITGMVIGPGIFKTPALVAANSADELTALSLWALGGLVSFVGALCYAELSSAYPNAGGEYHYLTRSFGRHIAFLFAWARMTVIQTGSIAMLSFVIGDYASGALYLGPYSSSIYAALTIIALTLINLKGILFSSSFQKLLVAGLFSGLIIITMTGLAFSVQTGESERILSNSASGIGQALIFILLTYGGWNEASYISADVSRKRKDIVKVLFYSIGIITFTYLIINLSLIHGLGLNGISSSNAVAADLVGKTFGQRWVKLISIIISVAAISTVNAVMITGARTNYALGMDFRTFSFLSHLKKGFSLNAFLFQSAIALALVGFGSFARNSFVTMVEYTAPVFWLFFLLVGISLFVLRHKEANIYRPFLVPLYPVIPVIFCLAAAYMLYSSLAYTGGGALTGLIVLCAGVLFLFIDQNK
jgi:amino acid transporter